MSDPLPDMLQILMILNVHEPRVRSNYGKDAFKFAITKIWEEVPTNIKTLSYYQFKKQYKSAQVTTYNDSITLLSIVAMATSPHISISVHNIAVFSSKAKLL